MRIPMHAPNAADSSSPSRPAARPQPAAAPTPAVPTRVPFRRHPVCLLLAVAFTGVVAFTPPEPYSHGAGFIGYLIGACLVGLLVPWLIATLVYWISGRSSFACNLTFGLLVAWVLAGALFNLTPMGKEMTSKLQARIRAQMGSAAAPESPAGPHIVTKGAPEVRVYKRSTASAPEGR